MQLTSLPFFGCFALLFALYWLVGQRARTPILFAASLLFYTSFGAEYLVLLLASCLFTWAAGLMLAKNSNRFKLAVSVIIALAPLLLVKYFDFGATLLGQLCGMFSLPFQPLLLHLAQPVGISYFTFQMVSYLVDVARKKMDAEPNFMVCSLFLCFFPQVLAGPMTRPRLLAGEFRKEKQFCCERALSAGQLIVLGLYKKLVVADTLGYYTDLVFADAGRLSSGSLLFIAFSYTILIYADFSGYTDVARGVAALLGVELAENFKTPYLSSSVKEFWGRWHISLSSWLQEYVYIPLGGSRCSPARHRLNLLITFFVSGLWHGASLPMVIWGLLHGVYLVAGDITRPARDLLWNMLGLANSRLRRVFGCVFTFCLVAYAWIWFASPGMVEATYFSSHLFSDLSLSVQYIKNSIALLGMTEKAFFRQCWCIGSILMMDLIGGREGFATRLNKARGPVKWAVCTLALALVVLFGSLTDSAPMYFDF